MDRLKSRGRSRKRARLTMPRSHYSISDDEDYLDTHDCEEEYDDDDDFNEHAHNSRLQKYSIAGSNSAGQVFTQGFGSDESGNGNALLAKQASSEERDVMDEKIGTFLQTTDSSKQPLHKRPRVASEYVKFENDDDDGSAKAERVSSAQSYLWAYARYQLSLGDESATRKGILSLEAILQSKTSTSQLTRLEGDFMIMEKLNRSVQIDSEKKILMFI